MSFSGRVGLRQGKDGRGDFANEEMLDGLGVRAFKANGGKGYCVAKFSEACDVVYTSNGLGFTLQVSMIEAC